MGILQTLKRILGIGEPGESDRTDTQVTVEHEPSEEESDDQDSRASAMDVAEEASGDEESVAEGSAAGGDEADVDSTTADESVAAGTDAAASTGSLVDETAADEPEEAAEPAEATASGSGAPESAGGESAPVETIKGIGPAYAERLSGIGIETVDDLAAADPADIAERANVGEKRAATWIERAGDAS
ncbi:helix-hairpin-helix domain-containing protein [Halopenitus sp. H-Gu1]|uniref:helix-hairpin-helix domain-containing protein n=1 Tax=Halopenitus sp. H-Gu1 TaxID=3242697 RepID=UPI00359F070A